MAFRLGARGVPVLLAASIAPARCGGSSSGSQAGEKRPDAGAPDATGDVATPRIDVVGPEVRPPDVPTGDAACGPWAAQETFEVELPPEGAPATPAALCAASASPVASNRAARVVLTRPSQALHLAVGRIDVDPAVLGRVAGTPTVEAVDATDGVLLQMTATNVRSTSGGFVFDARWPDTLRFWPSTLPRVTVKTTLGVRCGDAGARVATVESLTHVNLCGSSEEDAEWVSSGDDCTVCYTIAEMAPSPTVRRGATDALPLARALRLEIREVARVGRSRVLLAEHDGGAGLAHRWRATAGEVVRIASDVVVWTPPDDARAHLLQVVVEAPDAAAVACLRRRAAA